MGKGRLGVSKLRHSKGCSCKRSGCLKNYCECYEASGSSRNSGNIQIAVWFDVYCDVKRDSQSLSFLPACPSFPSVMVGAANLTV